MSRLGAVNNVHMQSETAVQNLKTTACAKKQLEVKSTEAKFALGPVQVIFESENRKSIVDSLEFFHDQIAKNCPKIARWRAVSPQKS